MSRQPAIDAPLVLAELLKADDLDEVARCCAKLHGSGVAILDHQGALAVAHGAGLVLAELRSQAGDAGDLAHGGGRVLRRPFEHNGELLGTVFVGPYSPDDAEAAERADVLAEHLVKVLGAIVHAAHARHLTTIMHVAALEEAFAALVRKNEQLLDAIERMQDLDRMKTNFLATVSHELRTPLTSVIGYSEMLIEGLAGPLNDEQADYVGTVLGKADQLLQLITGILDASLIESGSFKVSREPVPLNDVVDSVVATFAPQATKRGVSIAAPRVEVPQAIGDQRKIRQVLWNLVANAVKFTSPGGNVSVAVEVGPLSPHADSGRFGPVVAPAAGDFGLRIHVRDSGIGISAEKLEHIFEAFFQVDSSSTREYGGTGLGLTLAKRYVEAHGGQIWVDSKLGDGSVFTVSLPAVPDELEAYLSEHHDMDSV